MGLSQGKPAMTACVEPARGNICAIVVTYFPDAHFGERLGKIKQQVGHTVIVDNTGEANPSVLLQTLDCTDAEIIRNKENLGIGEALNQGMARAIQLGFPWTITFDQDSWVRPELAETLIDIYKQQVQPETVGIIGSNIEDENIKASPNKYQPGGPNYTEIGAAITSGSLMCAKVFGIAGPFRADFFIDLVDIEYCLRLRKMGFTILNSKAPLMVHALGAATLVSFGGEMTGLSLVLTNRSPLRRYYMTRNAILVATSYFAVAPKWAIRTFASVFAFALLKIPLEKQARARKFLATLWGAVDAVRGTTGRANARWLYE
jgi:rhamnosyltransferase